MLRESQETAQDAGRESKHLDWISLGPPNNTIRVRLSSCTRTEDLILLRFLRDRKFRYLWQHFQRKLFDVVLCTRDEGFVAFRGFLS
jgi:hypothetical protein